MRRVALALLAWAALTGCRTLPGAGTLLEASDPRPGLVLAELSARAGARHGVRAAARVSLSGQRGASFARQLLLLERPARMRVEVMGMLGQRIAILATDGARYQLYRAETGVLEEGEMHPAILSDVAGVPLSPALAVALLLGAPEPIEADPPGAYATADGWLRLVWPALAGRPARMLQFDPEGRLRRYAVGAGDDVLLTAEWDDYQELGDGAFAHRVAMTFPGAGAQAEVSFSGVELNPSLPEELFRLEPVGRVSSPAGGGP